MNTALQNDTHTRRSLQNLSAAEHHSPAEPANSEAQGLLIFSTHEHFR